MDEVYSATGGHPYLLRDFASSLARRLPVVAADRSITKGQVNRRVSEWRRSVAGNVEEMIGHLERFYPEEGLLLEYLVEDPEFFYDYVQDQPQALEHLIKLGLVDEPEPGRYAATPMLQKP